MCLKLDQILYIKQSILYWVLIKQTYKSWPSQRKRIWRDCPTFAGGRQGTWDLKCCTCSWYEPGKLGEPGQLWQVEQWELACQHHKADPWPRTPAVWQADPALDGEGRKTKLQYEHLFLLPGLRPRVVREAGFWYVRTTLPFRDPNLSFSPLIFF